jgi:hypothetical protein
LSTSPAAFRQAFGKLGISDQQAVLDAVEAARAVPPPSN